MENDFTTLVDLAQTVGQWFVFLYLYLKERDDHKQTRHAHMTDLRDIIGMSDRLRPPDPPE